MRLFIDCEFNGFGGQLMSLAVVSEDGREWYEVLPLPEQIEPWVNDNVVPVLGKSPLRPDVFRASLHVFLGQFAKPTVVADWYTDLVHFFAMFAGRDHSESIHYPCQAQLVADVPGYAPQIPHNALSDARAIRAALT